MASLMNIPIYLKPMNKIEDIIEQIQPHINKNIILKDEVGEFEMIITEKNKIRILKNRDVVYYRKKPFEQYLLCDGKTDMDIYVFKKELIPNHKIPKAEEGELGSYKINVDLEISPICSPFEILTQIQTQSTKTIWYDEYFMVVGCGDVCPDEFS